MNNLFVVSSWDSVFSVPNRQRTRWQGVMVGISTMERGFVLL